MSYQFSVQAKTKEDAIAQVTEKVAVIANAQPPHKIDEAAIVASATGFINALLPLKEDQDYNLTIYGSIWADDAYTGARQVSIHIEAATTPNR